MVILVQVEERSVHTAQNFALLHFLIVSLLTTKHPLNFHNPLPQVTNVVGKGMKLGLYHASLPSHTFF